MKLSTIQLAFVDDHQIVIDGLMSLLKGHDRFRFAFATTDPKSVLEKLKDHPVDILLTDVMMPGMNGNELAKAVKKQFPAIKILALSMSGEGDIINEMINYADISGYVVKNIGKQELITALEKIAEGGMYFSDEVIQEMQRSTQRKKQNEEAHLTEREIEILRGMVEGLDYRQIGEKLFVSPHTVRTHIGNIYKKLHVCSKVDAVKIAIKRQWF